MVETKQLLKDMYKTKDYINTVRTDLPIDEYILISEFIEESVDLIIITLKNKTPLKQKALKQIEFTLSEINSNLYKKLDMDIIDYYYFKRKN